MHTETLRHIYQKICSDDNTYVEYTYTQTYTYYIYFQNMWNTNHDMIVKGQTISKLYPAAVMAKLTAVNRNKTPTHSHLICFTRENGWLPLITNYKITLDLVTPLKNQKGQQPTESFRNIGNNNKTSLVSRSDKWKVLK